MNGKSDNNNAAEFWDDIGQAETTHFEKAYAVAKDAHAGQLRDEGAPYITHIDGVLDILRNELKIGSDLILTVAALHDVLEDSDKYSAEDLSALFGDAVSEAVQLLTKKDGRSALDYLDAIDSGNYSPWLMIVKLADRLNNIRCLAHMDNLEKKARKCLETRRYFMDYARKYSEYIYNELGKSLGLIEKELYSRREEST